MSKTENFKRTIDGINFFKPNLKNEKGQTLLYMVVKKGKFKLSVR